MCKKMKAFYYLPNYNVGSCLNTYSNQYLFSEIDETNLWCDPDRYSSLLGLLGGIESQALSLIILIASVVIITIF